MYHAMGNVLYNRCAFYPIPMNKKEKKKKEKKKKKLVLIRLEFSIEIEEDWTRKHANSETVTCSIIGRIGCSSWQDIPHQLQVWPDRGPLPQKIQTSATIIWIELYRVPVNLNSAVDFKILVIDMQSTSQTSIISILKPSDIRGHSKIISLRWIPSNYPV